MDLTAINIFPAIVFPLNSEFDNQDKSLFSFLVKVETVENLAVYWETEKVP